MNKLIKIAGAATAALIISTSLYAYQYLHSPSGQMTEDVSIEIRPGASFYSVARMLKEKDVIDSVRKFHIYARSRGALQSIKAGEYLFEPTITPRQILDKLLEGSVINHRVTIPEGYNIYQIADLLDEKGLVARDEFIAAAFDKELMRDLGVNGASFEGYLYPETYFLVKGMNGEDIIRQMYERFSSAFPPEFELRGKELGFSKEDVVNLASIIEKETGNPAERPLISAVFHNRLRKRIRLQSDPTVIYGMMDRFDGDLRKKDLKKKTPYNTYRINGLPAGPIANPGIDSIRAVLYPADVDYIYFVSKNNGSHVFARTLEEHNRNVWRYQKRKRR